MEKLLLDLNIIIDIVESRPRLAKIKKLLAEYNEFYISTHTYSTLFYVLRKSGLQKQQINEYISFVQIIDTTVSVCREAYLLAKNADDVEDCIEIMIAKSENMIFVTADIELATTYKRACRMIVNN